ncbi:hypothetical protein [Brucella anthropi]|uniref:hypothetical protein n=1 Tax=Brucella anthropi TaxID=529 RepID=UPI003987EC86
MKKFIFALSLPVLVMTSYVSAATAASAVKTSNSIVCIPAGEDEPDWNCVKACIANGGTLQQCY